MKALLISTYELGHQPLGLAWPLAHLRAAGVDVRGLDLSVEPLDEAAVQDAAFIGISTPMHTALRLGVQAAKQVRALNPGAHICFYGLYAGLNSGYLLRTVADSVIAGEVEDPLVRSALAVAASRDAERTVTFLGRQQFLLPERESLPPLASYAHLIHAGAERIAGAVEASRGCAHHCLHCPIPPVYGGRLRIVPADVVLADVRQVVELGAEHITFADPDFFNGVRHSMAVVRALHDQFPRLTFDATIKVEHLLEHRGMLPELGQVGCLFITSAVESLSETVLRNLDKGHTASDVSEALALTRAAGIALRPTFLPFTPWTTIDDYLHLLAFIGEHDLVYSVDPVQYAIRLLVPPGSSLLASAAMRPFLGTLNEADFAYEWWHPDPRMDRLAKDVTALVAEAAGRGTDPGETFAAVVDLARTAAGQPAGAPWCPVAPRTTRSPRLSESWFCCAEPTTDQLVFAGAGAAGV